MKYWLARWVISPKQWRYSLGFWEEWAEEILDDSKYLNTYEWFCTQYIFKCNDNVEFSEEKIKAFNVEMFFSKESAKQWILDNMTLPEVSPYVFEVSPGGEVGGVIIEKIVFSLD